MLPGGTDTLYRDALSRPHTQYLKVEVLDGAGNVLPLPPQSTGEDGGLLIGPGSLISATLQSRVTRRLQIIVDQSLYPSDPGDLLAPYGNRLRVTSGIKFADGSRYAWTAFTGRIQLPVLSPDGLVLVPAADRAYEVAEFGFQVPMNSQVGNNVNAEFVRLVSDAVPDAVFGASDTFAQTMPALTWESDRAGAIDEFSTTVGAFWYALADGRYAQRYVPWTVPGSPVLTLSDGTGGVLLASPSRNREDVWNSITVTSERPDGTPPVYANAQDTNPLSPTYVNGTFGKRHKTVRLQTPQTQGSAQSAANDYLRRTIALQETWSWTMPPDGSLELGDIVSLNAYDRTGVIQVVSGFLLPLEVGAMMTVQAHAQVIGILA